MNSEAMLDGMVALTMAVAAAMEPQQRLHLLAALQQQTRAAMDNGRPSSASLIRDLGKMVQMVRVSRGDPTVQ